MLKARTANRPWIKTLNPSIRDPSTQPWYPGPTKSLILLRLLQKTNMFTCKSPKKSHEILFSTEVLAQTTLNRFWREDKDIGYTTPALLKSCGTRQGISLRSLSFLLSFLLLSQQWGGGGRLLTSPPAADIPFSSFYANTRTRDSYFRLLFWFHFMLRCTWFNVIILLSTE